MRPGVGGTNCDAETQRAFTELGAKAEIVQVNDMIKKRNLSTTMYWFSREALAYGDYVRSGVIFARHLSANLGKEIQQFVDEGRPVLGICNGFQIMVEYGLLPGLKGISEYPEASLANNTLGYKCRWTYMKNENKGKCVFTTAIPQGKVLHMPIAHGEGRLLFPKEKEQELLKKLIDEDMLVFRYCNKDGEAAEQIPSEPKRQLL